MKIINSSDIENTDFYSLLKYDNISSIDEIVDSVAKYGDSRVLEFSEKFGDGNFRSADDFLVDKAEIESAYKKVSKEFINHIEIAKANIENFAKNQLKCIKNLDINIGNSFLGHKILPINSVLCYVPGGNFPLVSTTLMTAVPAKVAGVKNVILTSPKIKNEVIVAAHIAGADKIYKIGGAQAISAFAYGTETLNKVDKIVGPGNKYVTYAKKRVFGTVDIDFLAGPSEVLIIADESANPKLIAADMLAQCEHDKDARAYLITNSSALANEVNAEAKNFLRDLKTADIASVSFEKSYCVLVNSLDEAVCISNKRAPEHLEIMCKDTFLADKLTNYGSLFIGENCAEVFGDYVSGTNHVLPTNSASKYTGGLSVFDFIKILTYQKIDESYAKTLSNTASFIADAEGLLAHKLASDLRGKNEGK